MLKLHTKVVRVNQRFAVFQGEMGMTGPQGYRGPPVRRLLIQSRLFARLLFANCNISQFHIYTKLIVHCIAFCQLSTQCTSNRIHRVGGKPHVQPICIKQPLPPPTQHP